MPFTSDFQLWQFKMIRSVPSYFHCDTDKYVLNNGLLAHHSKHTPHKHTRWKDSLQTNRIFDFNREQKMDSKYEKFAMRFYFYGNGRKNCMVYFSLVEKSEANKKNIGNKQLQIIALNKSTHIDWKWKWKSVNGGTMNGVWMHCMYEKNEYNWNFNFIHT